MSFASTTFEFAQKSWNLIQFQDLIRKALSQDVGYSSKNIQRQFVADSNPQIRKAHVLLLVGASENEGPQILMTKRTEKVETHKGQMALPGGMEEEADRGLEEYRTALRETHEEVGIPPSSVKVIGGLPTLPTYSSGFSVTPWVGTLEEPIHKVSLITSNDEIETAFWISLKELEREGVYSQEWFQPPGVSTRYATHAYNIYGHRIWGATGAILKNFLDRLKLVIK